MSPTFTGDDVGKTVENADGTPLGVVVAVDEDTAYVDPERDIADSTRARLDWGDASDGPVPLPGDAVGRITDDAVRLEPEFAMESADDEEGSGGGADPAASPGGESTTDVGESDLGSETAAPDEPGPGTDDLDDVDDERLTDASTEIDGDEERGTTVPEDDDPIEEVGVDEERDPAAEMDAPETDDGRDLEVDPTDLTDDDPEIEIRPEEDVGDRTDVRNRDRDADR